jgi:hypothetical protein
MTSSLIAQDAKPTSREADERIRDALKTVHNKGADLYNESRDFMGTYRMYQGALVTVRPLLGNKPGAQRIIDEGLAVAEKEQAPAQKAFKLHETIEAVRELLKSGAEAGPKTQPAETKKPAVETKPSIVDTKPRIQLEVAPPPHDKK